MRDRTRARGWALQVLYAWDARDRVIDPVQMLGEFFEERRIARSSHGYLRDLVEEVASHLDEIDGAVESSLTNWRLDRLSAIDRNVLRLATAEMLYIEDVPLRVSIQEAIILAEKYGTRDSPRFVNGVLDGLMTRLEEQAGSATPRDGPH